MCSACSARRVLRTASSNSPTTRLAATSEKSGRSRINTRMSQIASSTVRTSTSAFGCGLNISVHPQQHVEWRSCFAEHQSLVSAGHTDVEHPTYRVACRTAPHPLDHTCPRQVREQVHDICLPSFHAVYGADNNFRRFDQRLFAALAVHSQRELHRSPTRTEQRFLKPIHIECHCPPQRLVLQVLRHMAKVQWCLVVIGQLANTCLRSALEDTVSLDHLSPPLDLGMRPQVHGRQTRVV